MSSPVYALFRSMLQDTSARNEGSVFIDDAIRKRLLTGVFDAYYAETTPETVIFDTNRGWTTKLPALVELFADAKVICCVRNPAWVLDSVESLIRRNAFELSGIFSYESGGTVYSRVEGLASAGRQEYGWSFDFAYPHTKSGSLSPLKHFAYDIRDIVRRQPLPGYSLAIERAPSGKERLSFKPSPIDPLTEGSRHGQRVRRAVDTL